jgi:uncharacterized protein YjbI with pentapeptide repeats
VKQHLLIFIAFIVSLPLLGDHDSDLVRARALMLLSNGEAGIVEFNHWREGQPAVVISLARANLKGMDLRQANLAMVDLSEADLSGAKLWRSYFYRANLRGANLTNVSFEGADFRGVSYVYATMSQQLLLEIESQNRGTVILVK